MTRQAANIYETLGIKPYAYKFKLNYASILGEVGDSVRAGQIISDLVKDPYTYTDHRFAVMALGQGYKLLDTDSLLQAYYRIAEERKDMPYYSQDANYCMSLHVYEQGDTNAALACAGVAMEFQKQCRQSHDTHKLWDWYARLLKWAGRDEEAWEMLDKSSQLKDSLYASDTERKISSVYAKSQIEQLRLNKEWDAHRSRLIFLLVLTLTGLVAAILTGLLYRRNTRLRLASAQSSLDLERNRKILGQAILSIEEKNKVIERLSGMPDSVVDGKALRRLRLNEKRHDDSLDHLQMLYDSVSSRLIVRLREKAPAITPAMQQLAVLLVCGLDTKEIAAIMNITSESVKKARYRLRKLLGVSHSENLTDVLKGLAAG